MVGYFCRQDKRAQRQKEVMLEAMLEGDSTGCAPPAITQ